VDAHAGGEGRDFRVKGHERQTEDSSAGKNVAVTRIAMVPLESSGSPGDGCSDGKHGKAESEPLEPVGRICRGGKSSLPKKARGLAQSDIRYVEIGRGGTGQRTPDRRAQSSRLYLKPNRCMRVEKVAPLRRMAGSLPPVLRWNDRRHRIIVGREARRAGKRPHGHGRRNTSQLMLNRLAGELRWFLLAATGSRATFLYSGAGKCMDSVGIPIDFYRHARLSSTQPAIPRGEK